MKHALPRRPSLAAGVHAFAAGHQRLTATLNPVATAVAAALIAACGHGMRAYAAPTDGQVTAGSATIQQSGTQTVINQSTQRAAIDWNGFSINVGEAVIFRQPSVSSVALNRVVGPNPSQILGSLQANGHVFLINASGILFGRSASVDVAGLVASTLNISNNDFMSGRYVFSGGPGTGTVVNQGTIRTIDGGYVALLANRVVNDGTISATKGSVALGAGEAMVLDFSGDGLMSLKVNAAAAGARIDHNGIIVADGGRVIMSAQARNALLDTVLNVDGIVQAKGVVERNGQIWLDGGTSGVTQVTGTLDASSTVAGQKGGEVRVLGEYVGLFGNAALDVSGAGGGGTVLVGGDFQGKNPGITNARQTIVGRDVTISADATANGDGGKVIVWSDDGTRYAGSISAKGGASGGDGGFVEVSGKRALSFSGAVDTTAPRGTVGRLRLDPLDINIVNGIGADDSEANDSAIAFADRPGDTLQIGAAKIGALATAVELQAEHDITVTAGGAITKATGDLTLRAGNDVRIDDTIAMGSGNLVLSAKDPGAAAPAAGGTVRLNAAVSSTGGNIGVTNNAGTAGIDVNATITTSGGNVTLAAGGALTVNQAITTTPGAAGAGGGSVTLTSNSQVVTAGAGTITTSGASGASGAAGSGGSDGAPGNPGGNAGSVTVRALGNGIIDVAGTITAVGGSGGTGGNGDRGANPAALDGAPGAAGAGGAVNVRSDGGEVLVSSIITTGGSGAGAGGAGGTITVTSPAIGLRADLNSRGGDAQGFLVNSGGAGGAITLEGPVTLRASTVSINTRGGGPADGEGSQSGASGDVRFSSSIDSTTAYTEGLTIQAGAANVIFEGVIGGLPLGDLLISGAGNVGGNADATIAAPAITARSVTQAVGSNTHLSSITTRGVDDADGGAVTINVGGRLTLGGTLDASGGAATVAGRGRDGGVVTLTGGVMSMRTITTSGTNAPNGSDDRGGNAGAIRIAAAGDPLSVTLNGNLTTQGGNASGSGNNAGGAGGNIRIDPPARLASNVTVEAHGGIATGSGIVTHGDVSFFGAIDSLSAGAPKSLTVNTGGTTTFNVIVGANAPLLSVTTDAGGSTFVNGTGIATTGGQIYNDRFILGADTTLAGTAAGNITFNSTIESTNAGPPQFGLTVNTTGTTTFAANVGPIGTLAPSFLTIGSGGTTVFTGSGPGDLRVITTDGPQSYGSPVVLAVDTNFLTCGCNPGSITFGSSVNADAVANSRKLGASAVGSVIFSQNVGNVQPLAELSVTTNGVAGAQILFNGSAPQTLTVTATGGAGVVMDGPVALAQNVTIDSGGSPMFFNNKIDGGFVLSTSSSATTRFSDVIGSTTPLASFSAAGAIDLSAATVRTTGAQTYNGTVTLAPVSNATTLTSTGGGNIGFSGLVDGNGINPQALTISTSGTTTFGDLVGSNNRLERLTMSGGGAVVISTPAAAGVTIGTNAAQSYSGPVTLAGADVFLVSDGGSPSPISFASTVDSGSAGARALTVTTSGQVTFGGAVGGIRALDALTTNGGGAVAVDTPTIAGTAIITVNAQNYDQTVSVGGATGPVEFRGGSLAFGGAPALAVGNRPLTLTTDALTFGGNVSGTGTLLIQPTADGVLMNIAGGAGTLNLSTADLNRLQNGFTSITLGRATATAATLVDAVTFQDPVTIRGLSVFVNGPITGTDNASVTLTPMPFLGGGIELGANIRTSGRPIALNGPVTLTTNNVLVDPTCAAGGGCTTSAGADVTFASTIRADNAGGQDRTLTVTAGNGTATFGGNIGVGAGRALADLDVTAALIRLNGATINVNDANAPAAAVTFTGPITLGADVSINTNRAGTSDTSVSFSSTIDANNSTTGRALAIDAGSSTVTFNRAIGATGPLSDLDVTAGTITFNSSIPGNPSIVNVNAPNATPQVITLNGNVVLPAGLVLDTDRAPGTASGVAFGGTVDGPGSLAVLAGSAVVTFGGNVGFNTPLTDLDVGAGRINLNASTFNLNGGTTAQSITFGGPVVLGVPTVTINTDRTGTSDSSVVFGPIDADSASNNRALGVLAGNGVATFTGNIGGSAALTDLDVTAGSILLNANLTNISLNGGSTVGTSTFTGPVTLGAPGSTPVLITVDKATGLDGTLNFTSSIAGGSHPLTLAAGTGQIDVAGAINAASLTATAQSAINLGLLTTTSAGATLTSDRMALNGIGAAGQTVTLRNFSADRAILLGGETSGSLSLSAPELAGISAQRLVVGRIDGTNSGAITIGSDVSPNVSTLQLFTAGGVIGTAGGIVMPSGTLAIDSAGTVNITDPQNDVGTLTASVPGASLTFNDASALTLGSINVPTGASNAITVTAVGDLTLANPVTSASGSLLGNVTLTSSAGRISGSGLVTGNNVVLDSATGIGTGAGARVNTSAATLAARSRTSGGVFVDETNAVTLNTIGAVQNSAAGSQGYDLVAAGAITVNGPVSTANVNTSGVPGTNATSGGIALTASGTIIGAGSLTTGNATANGGTATSGSIALNAQRVGSSGGRLDVNTGVASGGASNVQGQVAATLTGTTANDGLFLSTSTGVRLAAIDMTASGAPVDVASTNGSAVTLAGNVTTNNGAVSFGAPVYLGNDVVVAANGGTVTFIGSVQSPLTPRSLTATTSGLTTFGSAVGGNGNPLSTLTVNGGGTTAINGGAVTTTGNQTYNDAIMLGANTVLTGATPTFSSTVNGGGNDLTLNFSGVTSIDGATFTGIRNLATGSGGTTSLTGTLATTGTQTYNDNVTLAGNTTLTGTTPTFGGTVTGGGNDLTLNFSGTTGIDGAAFTGIRNLATGNGGTTSLTGALTTTGTQTYDDAIVLAGNTTLTGTTPTFGGTVAGAGNDLTLNFSGTTSIDGAMFNGVSNLTTGNGGVTSLAGALSTTGTQTYNDNVMLAGTTALDPGAGSVTFAGTLEAPATSRGLSITAGNVIRFGGAVGGNGNALASLTTVGGTTRVDGGAVTTTGTQTYNNAVVIGANTSLSSTSGNITFGNALDADAASSNRTLLVNAPTGTVTFSGNVGASQAFADLDVIAGPNTIVFNGAAPQSVNVAAQGGNTATFNGPVRLDQDLTINSGGAASNSVAFAGTINGNAANVRMLTVNAGTGNVSVGTAGDVVPLATLTTNGNTVSFGGSAVAQQIFIVANQVLIDPLAGLIKATLPFAGFNGPAALTLSGPSTTGGIFGTESNALHVDVPGLLVVTPNESRSFPTVWLRGDPSGKPRYQFYQDPARREVVYNSRPVLFDLELKELREDRERRLTIEEAESAAGQAKEPDLCNAASSDANGVLMCEVAKRD